MLHHLIKDTLLRDRERKKAQHLAGIESMTSKVLLCRCALYHFATAAALYGCLLNPNPVVSQTSRTHFLISGSQVYEM